jgi:anthranilate synthase component 2
MIDNYDSFTFNLKALFNGCGAEVKVIHNDEFIPAEGFEGVIISPGPSSPREAGTSIDYLEKYTGILPIFGVCLGMQCIGYVSGKKIIAANTIRHGKLDPVTVTGKSVLFHNIPEKFNAVRYHSLAVDFSGEMMTSVSDSDSTPMSYEDPANKLFGVQFHPESVLSEYGREIVLNYMNFCSNGGHNG